MNIAASTALVTGASRGLGRSLAAELANHGVRVYSGTRQPDSVDLPGVTPIRLDNPGALWVSAHAAKR